MMKWRDQVLQKKRWYKVILLIVGGFALGYLAAFGSLHGKIAHFPKFQLRGELWLSATPQPLDQPGFYSPLGVLNNEMADAIFILDIRDGQGRYAHITQVTLPGNQGGYYAPGSLRLNLNTLSDTAKTMLVPSGGSVSFSFDERPVGNLLVRYVVLGDPLAVPQTLGVRLD